jgi:PIN domain nuclease of toxin-antitoxin system
MNLLLDTHIILWWLKDDPLLSARHKELISNTEHVCFISAASIWEISIKSALGKLEIPDSYIEELRLEGFQELPIHWKHTNRVKYLPFHHRDPFDRLLIAQAKIEKFTLLTVDEYIPLYGIETL